MKKLVLALFVLSSFPLWSIEDKTVFEELSEEKEVNEESSCLTQGQKEKFCNFLRKKSRRLKHEHGNAGALTGSENFVRWMICGKTLLWCIGSNPITWEVCLGVIAIKCLFWEPYKRREEIERVDLSEKKIRESLRNKTS